MMTPRGAVEKSTRRPLRHRWLTPHAFPRKWELGADMLKPEQEDRPR